MDCFIQVIQCNLFVLFFFVVDPTVVNKAYCYCMYSFQTADFYQAERRAFYLEILR